MKSKLKKWECESNQQWYAIKQVMCREVRSHLTHNQHHGPAKSMSEREIHHKPTWRMRLKPKHARVQCPTAATTHAHTEKNKAVVWNCIQREHSIHRANTCEYSVFLTIVGKTCREHTHVLQRNARTSRVIHHTHSGHTRKTSQRS